MNGKNLYLWLMAWIGGSIQAGIHAGGAPISAIFLFIVLYTIAVISLGNLVFDEDK